MSKIKEFISAHIKITFFLCASVLSFAIYAQTLQYDFTFLDDSILILDNYETISNYKNIPSIFSTSVFNNGDAFYRPFLTLSFAVDAFIGGKDLFSYHLTQIFLHIAAVFLIFILMLKIGADKYFAFALTLLFAAHPSFVQAVAWIPGRNDSLLAVFIAATLIFLSDYFASEKKKTLKFILFVLSFWGALFTKETAVMAAAAFPLFIFAFAKKRDGKGLFLALLFMAVSVIAFMLLRKSVLGASGLHSSAAYTLISHLKSLPYYFECAFIPSRIMLVAQDVSAQPLTILSFCIFFTPLAAAVFFNIGSKKKAASSALWFAVFLLPLLMMDVQILYTHRLYIPVIGALTAFDVFFEALAARYAIMKKYIFFLIFTIIMIFSFASYMQSKKFQNEAVLAANALTESPDSYLALSMAAKYYLKKGMPSQALDILSKVRSKNNMARRDIVDYYCSCGYAYVLEGKLAKAEKAFEKALVLDDKNESALNNLAYIYYVCENYGKASEIAVRLVDFYPEKRKYRDYYEEVKSKKRGSA